MQLLAQFLLRLTFGLAVGMAITSPKLVTSGYFRNNLYVTLGLSAFAAMISYSAVSSAFWCAVAAAVASYIGSVCWLYEKQRAGQAALLVVALIALTATEVQLTTISSLNGGHSLGDKYFRIVGPDAPAAVRQLETWRNAAFVSGASSVAANVTSGLLLGFTTAAMLLGHWYLNSPTMELKPLRRLILAMGAAAVLQAAVSAAGLAGELHYAHDIPTHWMLFVVLRWSFGILGVAVLSWMAWETLKIPNTQSATGILYVAVIGVFVGELTAALLSANSAFPL